MFYAKMLNNFLKENPRGDVVAINYVFAIRTEKDLFNINEEYKNIYKTNLIDDFQVNFILY